MGWDLAQCEDEELIKYADRLNRCKESKVMLELELSNESFKLNYIHKRKQTMAAKARTGMMYAIPFTFVEIGCIAIFVSSLITYKSEGYDAGLVILMLCSVLGFLACGFICIKVWVPEIRMLKKFNPMSNNNDADKGTVTFEIERQMSEERISVLKEELKTIEDEIKHLSAKKRERELFVRTQLLEEKVKVFLGQKPVENQSVKSSMTYNIKKDEISSVQAEEMLRNLTEEIEVLKRQKNSLELEDKKLQDRIIEIDLNIYTVRDRVTTYILILAMVLIILSLFSGIMLHILNGVFCIVFVAYMLWVIHVCKEPVVSYLVEHDHKQIQDYAFTHSLTPVYKKRKELAKDLVHCAKEISILESKKQEIENLGLL